MFDAISLTANIAIIGYLIYSIITGGLQSFSVNYVFIGYLIFTILTLPNLLSKVIFKSKLFGISSALLFIYFPIQFLLQIGISKLTGLSLNEILPFGVLFNLILWNVLFILFIIEDNKIGNESEYILKEIISALLPAIGFILFVFLFIRQQDSVVALDYLQHLTVPNKMFNNGILCLLPAQCSNLFLQHGYTTFYHIIFGNVTTFLGNDPIKTFYILDIIFPLIVSIPIYTISKKTTGSTLWAQLCVILSLLTFVMGAYDFLFFIPQTFALYIFILTLREGKISKVQLILISLMLLSIHFIIGVVLAGYLWFKQLIVENLKTEKEKTSLLVLLGISVLFFFLANVAGFSVEKLIQQDAIEIVGSLTNAYYPNNIQAYIHNLNAGWLLLLLAYVGVLIKKRKEKQIIAFFSFISFGAIFYFLAPTYANKFTIGLGFFAAFIITQYIWSLGFKPILKLLLFTLLIFTWGLNFFIQYNRYLSFYTQESGVVSAITKEDKAIVEYIEENDFSNTFILSDPYTQIIITALGNVDTANAQYMKLETRRSLVNYLENPGVKTYEELLISPGIPVREDFFILHSSRLQRTIELNDYAWTYNIYSLPLNNSYGVGAIETDLLKEQKRLNRELIYISENFILFK